jgi:hypothetical protein
LRPLSSASDSTARGGATTNESKVGQQVREGSIDGPCEPLRGDAKVTCPTSYEDLRMPLFLRWWGSSREVLETAALRVAEVARQWLTAHNFVLQVQPVRPAVTEGYARVMAAHAVRRSMGVVPPHLAICDMRLVQELATARLTQRLVNHEVAAIETAGRRAA